MDDDRVKEKDQTGRNVGFLSAKATHGRLCEYSKQDTELLEIDWLKTKCGKEDFGFKLQKYQGVALNCRMACFVMCPSNGATAQIKPWPPPLRFLNHTQNQTR
jgi:hypothetical protein